MANIETVTPGYRKSPKILLGCDLFWIISNVALLLFQILFRSGLSSFAIDMQCIGVVKHLQPVFDAVQVHGKRSRCKYRSLSSYNRLAQNKQHNFSLKVINFQKISSHRMELLGISKATRFEPIVDKKPGLLQLFLSLRINGGESCSLYFRESLKISTPRCSK